MNLVWTCSCCGQDYATLSFAYALDQPDPWRRIPEAERKERTVLGTDGCVIDGREYFLRGRILIPVAGYDEPFIWGCWAAISEHHYRRVAELWNTPDREHEPPLSGTLASDIPLYPQTFGLPCSIHLKNEKRRPSFVIEQPDHPLTLEQQNGITLDRVKEFAAAVLRHKNPP